MIGFVKEDGEALAAEIFAAIDKVRAPLRQRPPDLPRAATGCVGDASGSAGAAA